MVKNRELFEFVIHGYTPLSLPMERLAEYLLDLSSLLGEREHVHFDRVAEGSAALRYEVDQEAIPLVQRHIEEAKILGSASPYRRAFESLDAKLREDYTDAEIRPVDENQQVGRLLYFPGGKRSEESDMDPSYGPFSEAGSIQGRIINVGGKSALANVNIQQEKDGQVLFCEASRALATEMAPSLYKDDVRVYGMGKYVRLSDGTWEMRSFRIASYEKLNQRPLADVVGRLRAITQNVGLDNDILQKLADLRNDPSEA